MKGILSYLAPRTAALAAFIALLASLGTAPGALAASEFATPDINMVLQDPRVMRRVTAWGVRMQDILHDVHRMQPAQRVQLALILTRRWQTSDQYSQSDLQAQFLVMLSLMRESELYARILTTGNARMFQ